MSLDVAAPSAASLVSRYTADGALFMHGDDGILVPASMPLLVEPGDDLPMRVAGRCRTLLSEAGVRLVAAALPFDGSLPVQLVPLLDADAGDPQPDGGVDAGPPLAWTPETAPDAYRDAVGAAVRRIERGELRKVVLARSMRGPAPAPRALRVALEALHRRDPHAYVFAMPLPATSVLPRGLIAGASPELLVSRRGLEVLSRPLAGSAPRGADAATDAAAAALLRASAKENAEHRFVVEAVADSLAPFCSELAVDRAPSLDPTATVWHLASSVRGRLRDRDTTAIDLAAALHPTPAVAGTPRPAALAAIAEIETVPRGFYAGCTGWVDSAGDGEWVVTLRCIEVRSGQARLFAGGGIVAGSDPDAELAETDAKFATMLGALTS
ncbi:MAG: isochorismate synthase [Candidatus Dormibacteria bacterium]